MTQVENPVELSWFNWIMNNDVLVAGLFGIMIFAFIMAAGEGIFGFLKRRSLGQREEVMKYLKLMFVETEQRKVTLAMLSSSFGLGILVMLLFWPRLGLGFVIGSIVTVGMWQMPLIIVKNLWSGRCKKFTDQMVDGMVMMANGIRAGLSVQQCMERVRENMANPMSQEFGLVLTEMQLGQSMNDSLNRLANRIPEQDVQMFVTAVTILNETGGNLAETFSTITETVRERQKVQKKIEAMTAQGLMQGFIISTIPFVLLLVFRAIDPSFVEPLFNTTLGIIALMIALVLIIIGGIVIKRIVTIKV
jgi:tight adherence protein B